MTIKPFVPVKIIFLVQNKLEPLRLHYKSLQALILCKSGKKHVFDWEQIKKIIYSYRWILQSRYKLSLFQLSLMPIAKVEQLLNEVFHKHPRAIRLAQTSQGTTNNIRLPEGFKKTIKGYEKKVAEKELLVFYLRVSPKKTFVLLEAIARFDNFEIPLVGLSHRIYNREKLQEKIKEMEREVEFIARTFTKYRRIDATIVKKLVDKYYLPKSLAKHLVDLTIEKPYLYTLISSLPELAKSYARTSIHLVCKVIGSLLVS